MVVYMLQFKGLSRQYALLGHLDIIDRVPHFKPAQRATDKQQRPLALFSSQCGCVSIQVQYLHI